MASGQDLWRSLKPFQDKSSDYLDAVASFLPQVERLNSIQKSNLSVFKSAELVNALLQIREKQQADDRFGAELAEASFVVVRAAIRERVMNLGAQGTIDLRDPQIRGLINEGCRLFHAGRRRPEQYQLALALSAAQCVVLHPWLHEGLSRYSKGCGLKLPEPLIQEVRDSFITPYHQQKTGKH